MRKVLKELYGMDYNYIIEYLQNIFKTKENIIVICIGTDRSTGDCLGPYIGTLLLQNTKFKYPVYGTLEEPIHALNIKTKLDKIKLTHPNAFIIAIDAATSEKSLVGSISLKDSVLSPGAAFNKDLPKVGDFSIVGFVSEFTQLKNVRLFNTIVLVNKIHTLLLNCI